MPGFVPGFILGFILFILVQLYYATSLENWLWLVAIIVLLYVIIVAFSPSLIIYSMGFVGFLLGIIVSLFFWVFLPEIQSFFASLFG